MARLNSYLFLINAVPSDQCACGEARETVEHFLFRCRRWTVHRSEMLQCTEIHRGNISFYLGGKSPSDDKNQTPDMKSVRVTIRFAMATGRLDADPWQGNSQQNRPLSTTFRPPNTNYLVPQIGGTASAAEDRTLNTWRMTFKLAC